MSPLKISNMYILFLLICAITLTVGIPNQVEAKIFGFDDIGDMFDGGGAGAASEKNQEAREKRAARREARNNNSTSKNVQQLKTQGNDGGQKDPDRTDGSTGGTSIKGEPAKQSWFRRTFSFLWGKQSSDSQSIDSRLDSLRDKRRDRDDGRNKGTNLSPEETITELIPYTIQANVGREITVFLGKITLTDNKTPKKEGICKDNGKSYREGESTQNLTNSDGSFRSIADASFVCRDGDWKTEGSQPNTSREIFGDTDNNGTYKESVLGLSTSRKGFQQRAPSSEKPYIIGTTPSDDDATLRNRSRSTANSIENTLLVDYACDGSVDINQVFSTSINSLQSGNERIIPLSVRTETGPAGKNCFAFKVDTTNTIRETNERNNQTSWHDFIVSDVTTSTVVAPPVCPRYNKLLCGENETVVSGTIQANGCSSAPQCVALTGSVTPDDIMFEVKSYILSDETGSGVLARITSKDWSSEDIVLKGDEELAFRWDGSKYDQCLAFIYPETYTFNSNTTAVTGNTEYSGIAIKRLNHVYSIECTTEGATYKKEINVRAL